VKLPDVKAADFQVKSTQQILNFFFHIIKLSSFSQNNMAEMQGLMLLLDDGKWLFLLQFHFVWLIILQVQIPHSGTSTRRPPGSMRTRIRCPGGCQSSSI
jgi:hypothetical protein